MATRRSVRFVLLCGSLVLLGCTQGRSVLRGAAPQPAAAQEPAAPAESGGPGPGSVAIPGMTLAAKNASLELYFDEKTCAFAVADVATRATWFSNPPNADQDPLAAGENRDRLKSQLYVTYYTRFGQLQTRTSYASAVSFGSFKTRRIPNGFRVDYLITDNVRIWIIPRAISEQRFTEWFTKRMDKQKLGLLKYYYKYANRAKVTSEEMLKQYPLLKRENIYIFESKSRDKGVEIPDFIKEELEQAILATGYNAEELARDHAMNGVSEAETMKPFFSMPLEVTLDGSALVVRVPMDEIAYDARNFPINRIGLLQLFGAAGPGEDGYLLVPDGSGSLIRFNNGKSHLSPYAASVYGADYAIRQPRELYEPMPAYLPVFGLKSGGRSFFAIIEEGDALAQVVARVSGMASSYNEVSGEFTVLPRDELQLSAYGGSNVLQVFQPRTCRGDIRVRYAFFTGPDSGYARMARFYQQYLAEKYGMARYGKPGAVPFFLETIGAVDRNKLVLGLPVRLAEPLTTFDQARSIVRRLQDAGVGALTLKVTGWMRGGISHRFATRISYERRLGGRREFDALRDAVVRSGGEFYAETADLYARRSTFLTGFSPRTQSAKGMDRLPAYRARRWINTDITTTRLPYQYLVSFRELPGLFAQLARRYAAEGIGGIALRDAGSGVNSDFGRRSLIDRQQALRILQEELARLRASGLGIMLDGGDACAAPYARCILDAPSTSNQYYLTDEAIPFFQMVFSGYVRYAGAPINLAGDWRREALRAVATGAGVYFTWIAAEQSVLKHTDYDRLYSVSCDVWFDEAVELYRRYNAAMGSTYGERIVAFATVAPGVTATTFENGVRMLANFNDTSVAVDGITIGPLAWHADARNPP